MNPTPNLELDLAQLIETTGALQSGHFKLASGFHSSRFFRCIRLFRYPRTAEAIFDALAQRFSNEAVDYVLGANEAGSILAFEVAKRLGAEVAIAHEKLSQYSLIEGFAFHPSDRVLIVDDITTTGGTARQLLEIVADADSEAVGVGVIAAKGLLNDQFPCRIEVLITLEDLDAIPPESCPLCQQGLPLTV